MPVVDGFLRPDEILRLKRELELVHRFDDVVYKPCMNITETDLRKLSESEYFRKSIDETEAEKIRLIGRVLSETEPSQINFYILDDDEKK